MLLFWSSWPLKAPFTPCFWSSIYTLVSVAHSHSLRCQRHNIMSNRGVQCLAQRHVDCGDWIWSLDDRSETWSGGLYVLCWGCLISLIRTTFCARCFHWEADCADMSFCLFLVTADWYVDWSCSCRVADRDCGSVSLQEIQGFTWVPSWSIADRPWTVFFNCWTWSLSASWNLLCVLQENDSLVFLTIDSGNETKCSSMGGR